MGVAFLYRNIVNRYCTMLKLHQIHNHILYVDKLMLWKVLMIVVLDNQLLYSSLSAVATVKIANSRVILELV